MRKDFAGKKRSRYRNSAPEVAKAIVEEYINYYSPYWISGMSVTQAALDISKVEKLRQLVDLLAKDLEDKLIKDSVRRSNGTRRKTKQSFQDDLLLAHWETQSYNGELFVDLYDFCDCLENRIETGPIATKCRRLKRFLNREFVLKSCYSGALYQYSHGVSLYFPWSNVATNYWNLAFVRDSENGGWGRFLQTYTQLTRRTPRGVLKGSRLDEKSSPIGIGMSVRMTSDRMTSDRMTSDRMTSDRMTSDRMTSDRMTSDRMTSDRMTSDRMTSDRMTSDRMTSDRMTSDRMTSDRMTSDRMTSDRMTSDRMTSDRMTSDRMTSDRMTSDRMASGLSGNPVHSMRNPPIVFVPNECIRQRRNVLAGQDRLLSND